MKVNATSELLDDVINITWQAAERVLEIYQGAVEFSHKADGTPLTEADIASHNIITEKLHTLLQNPIVISEENAEQDGRIWSNPQQFWLVDPLDGTKEFIHRNGEFTINIALIEDGQPTLGVVCAPALNVLYAGLYGHGAFKTDKSGIKQQIAVSNSTAEGLAVVGSRSHSDPVTMDMFLSRQKIARFIASGSSLKFCLVAEGSVHLYPRLGRTMEWDTAAGHAVLAAAGGEVVQLDGNQLFYGKNGFENPYFIAKSRQLDLATA